MQPSTPLQPLTSRWPSLRTLCILLFAAGIASPASAHTYTFAAYDITLDLPESGARWRIDTTSHMRASTHSVVLCRAVAHDGDAMLLNVTTDNVSMTSLREEDIQAFTRTMISSGAQFLDSARTTLAGLPAFMIDARMHLDSGIVANVRSYIVINHGRMHNLMLISRASGAGMDSELVHIAASMRFSSVSQSRITAADAGDEGFGAGRIVARMLVPAAVLGLAIGLLVRRSRRRNAASAEPEDPNAVHDASEEEPAGDHPQDHG
ncbi:MAG TPA: hypothetical protein VHI13_16950 [Candidatus Kapabacteria bacterium]|nr:hypothetical protein [Candidatus Kapabacteria bacterium]